VGCLEDPKLVELLREKQLPLDVSPTSNVCLGVATSFSAHPLPKLIEKGLLVTINTDDPPMFNTTLTNEYIKGASAFGWGANEVEQLVMNGVRASLLAETEREDLKTTFRWSR
jgi:adenosine deaminase